MKKAYMEKDVCDWTKDDWRDYLADQVKKESEFAYAAFCQNNVEAEAVVTGRMEAFKEVYFAMFPGETPIWGD